MPVEDVKIYDTDLPSSPGENLFPAEKLYEMIEELNLKDTPDLWIMLFKSGRFEEIFDILAGGLRKILFNKIAEIQSLQNIPPSFNSLDMIRKGEIEEMQLQLLEIIYEVESLLDLQLKNDLVQRIMHVKENIMEFV